MSQLTYWPGEHGPMRIRALTLFVLALCALPARSEEPIRLVDDIERRLENQFIFTTSGGGHYEIYQRVDNRIGLQRGEEVICLGAPCYVQIAVASEADLRRAGNGNIETVRKRFRSTRDAYTLVQRASPTEVERAALAWQEARRAIELCLMDERRC